MPFYEYQCQACGAQVEVLQKISDAPLKKCPECGKSKLTKLVSAPIFRLKGGGWYETDFKSDSDRKRNLAGAEKDAPASDVAKPAADTAKADAPAKDAKPAADKPAAEKPAAKPVRSASASRSKAKSARPAAKKGRK